MFDLPDRKAGRKRGRKSGKKAETRIKNIIVKKNLKKKDGTKTQKIKQPVKTQDLLTGLNIEQARAVESTARAMVIQAGPGTGKTRTLTAKIAYLVSKKNVDPGSILALTFTNKAARQLEQKIDKYMPQKTKAAVLAATFHSFCLRLLKNYKGFHAAVMDDSVRIPLIREAMGGKPKRGMANKMDQLICQCKQNLLFPDDDLKEVVTNEKSDSFKKIYNAYLILCKERNVADFEDLIFMTVKMLTDDEAILSSVKKTYQYIFIDEYQDLNFGQYELAKMISQDNHIVVIGDPDQSIYGFRGSDNKYFKRFVRDFSGCEKILLSKNYRSTQTILDASFQMISKSLENEEKFKVFSDTKSNKKLMIKQTATEFAEAVAIGKMIEKLVGGTSFFSMDAGKTDLDEQKEYSFADFAILCRTSRQCEIFINMFEKEGIPFQAADKKKLFEIDGIKQLINFCRVMAQSSEFPDEIKDRDTEAWLKFLCKKEDLNKIIQGNDKAEKAFEKLLSIARLNNDLKSFLNALALDQDTDTLEFNVEKVSLMTMHAAKGLEFPVVFVAGCEQGLIPFAKDGKNIDDLEEERRLFYVAMTRAMDILCLTYAKKRSIYGKSFKRQRSFFIEDIEKRLIQVEKSFVHLKVRKKEKQLELF